MQQPDASGKAVKPKHSFFAIIGLILGLIGASMVMVYQLLFHETLISPESVKRILKLPVLTTVPVHPTVVTVG
ncbi:hypothetical protein CCP3SC15_500001 [Gammaproteobacteria bacterium]